jgi:hypothetical protein
MKLFRRFTCSFIKCVPYTAVSSREAIHTDCEHDTSLLHELHMQDELRPDVVRYRNNKILSIFGMKATYAITNSCGSWQSFSWSRNYSLLDLWFSRRQSFYRGLLGCDVIGLRLDDKVSGGLAASIFGGGLHGGEDSSRDLQGYDVM